MGEPTYFDLTERNGPVEQGHVVSPGTVPGAGHFSPMGFDELRDKGHIVVGDGTVELVQGAGERLLARKRKLGHRKVCWLL